MNEAMQLETIKAKRLTWSNVARRQVSLAQLVLSAAALGLLILAYAVSTHFQVHQQLYQYGRTWLKGNTAADKNIWLPDFHVVIDAKPLAPDVANISGITYDYDNDRLLAVTNKGPIQLLALNVNGDIIARYPLIGFDDTEGVAYLGNGRIVLCDEDLQQLDIITLPPQARPIHVEEAQFIELLINPSIHNKGFEGVTYDPANDRLFAIKERDPRQMFEVSGVLRSIDQGRLQIKIADRLDWITKSVAARDLSDGYYDPRTGHLLLLSDQSHSVTELDSKGRFVSIRSLLGTFSDLKHSAPQPEGLTMDRAGNLYVVSEPNLFYKFSKVPE
ncbi:SdiA-regulated [Pseudomonas syringae pv. aptata]|uniref:SdiA-regulated n=2 Tax=Pseudomonas syringae TaxID=317 RepID=A0A0Q0CA66_PSEAP|nr:SdiA-regulated [Pseudomonas syringae pv. aptata]RMN66030.1 SdiA-regulated [Pseudomonas syringae]RMO42584.1 SdiA-regulated [Pseudomonas syringae]RMO65132.1 SdiA-regulated [Pseudomonas syringae pv. aptata]